jgi:hypothetical protein
MGRDLIDRDTSFFHQPAELKEWISQDKSKFFNGWRGPRKTAISVGDGVDVKESMSVSFSFIKQERVTSFVPQHITFCLRS